jgi:urease accessory protein
MSTLTIIRQATTDLGPIGQDHVIKLSASRATIAKRRWRGTAADGREFGFDLTHALSHGAIFHAEGDARYCVEQEPEEVFEIPTFTPDQAARMGWALGNLHFPIQVTADAVRVADDSAVRNFLQREKITFRRVSCIFLPEAGDGNHHHHAHD